MSIQGFSVKHLYMYNTMYPCHLQIGKPCSFVVNFNGAQKGKLQARVVSPSGAEEEALVQEIDDGKEKNILIFLIFPLHLSDCFF